MSTKGKMWVDKDMILVDWKGAWRIYHVFAESESSVWIESRVPGAPPRIKRKQSTEGKFYETTPEGDAMARKKAAEAANQLGTLDLKIQSIERQGQEPDPDARRQDAQEETFELARMQGGEE